MLHSPMVTPTYLGISERLPCNPTTFTQFMLEREFCLSENKVPIDYITRVDTLVHILYFKTIETPIGQSLEGEILTGKELMVVGCLESTIIYVCQNEDQSVHSAHYKTLFCTPIVLPSDVLTTTTLTVTPYVESVFAQKSSCHCIAVCSCLLLDVKFCVHCTPTLHMNLKPLRVIGVNTSFPTNPLYFKSLIVEDTIPLPVCNLSVQNILSLHVQACVLQQRLVTTSENTSLEGQTLSGCKLIVDVQLNYMITYNTFDCTQNVYSAQLPPVIQSTFVIIPCIIEEDDLLSDCYQGHLNVTPYVQCAYAYPCSSRNIFTCTSLFINVTTH